MEIKKFDDYFFGKMEDLFPNIPDGSVNMIFADLPYGTTNCKWDSIIDLEMFWENCWRVLKDDGVVICTAQIPFNVVLGMSQIQFLKYEWIWEKTAATGHLNAKKAPMKAHENVMVFYKKQPTYNPIKTTGHKRKVSKGYQRNICINRRIENHGDDYIYGKETTAPDYDSTERYPRTVQIFASDKQHISLHPTQKPEKLLEYLIKTYTNEGDIVLDPCSGSCTTGIVSDKLNRKFIGFEKDEKFYNLGLIRRNFPNLKTKEILEIYNKNFMNK